MKQTEPFVFEGFNPANTTPVPDVFFDKLVPHLNEAQLKVMLYIIRRTLGFKKTEDAISLKQFRYGIKTRDNKQLDEGCGLKNFTTISKALKGLEQMKCVERLPSKTADGDDATTVYRIKFTGTTPNVVPTTPNGGGVLRQTEDGTTPNGGGVLRQTYPQETVLQETVLQETVLQEGEEEKAPSSSSQRKNILPFKPPQEKETVHLSEKERRRAEARGREAREQEIWRVIEEGRKTSYSKTQRASRLHSRGIAGLLEDDVTGGTIRHGLSVLTTWENQKFCVNDFYDWLPNLSTRNMPSSLKAVANGAPVGYGNDTDPYQTVLLPGGMIRWQGQVMTEDEAYDKGYNGGFEKYK